MGNFMTCRHFIFREMLKQSIREKKSLALKKENPYGICHEPTSAQDALNKLSSYLLGEDWYVTLPILQEQVNTCIVDSILSKYSKKYNEETEMLEKEQKRR